MKAKARGPWIGPAMDITRHSSAAAQWTQGYDGTALVPCASGQYLEAFGYPGVLGKRDRTVSAWIKTAAVGDIMGWGLGTDTQKWNFRVQTDNGNPGSIRVECQGGRICGWTDVRDGEWHHVAAVLKSTGAPTVLDIGLYVDGVQEAISDSLSVDVNTVGGTRNVRIGDAHQNRPFPGVIDDARIYDRALTQEELERVMRIDPLRAWGPQPLNGSIVDVRTATPLTWTKGDSASKHDVYFGIDAAAVAAADASDTTGIYRGRLSATDFTPPEDLEWGRKYFWRVDEVNTDGSITTGKVWTFTVADYLVVDDFESYTDEDGSRIYQTWIDGYADHSSGSTVGNLVSPFAERHDHPRRLAGAADGLQQHQCALVLRGRADLGQGAELDVRGCEHAGGALPRRGARVRRNGGGRRHPHGRRRGHLEYGRRVPLRLQTARRRRLDRRPGGQHREHERLGQGRRDDPRIAGPRFPPRVHLRHARQRGGVPAASGRRRHQRGHDSGRVYGSPLGETDPHRRHADGPALGRRDYVGGCVRLAELRYGDDGRQCVHRRRSDQSRGQRCLYGGSSRRSRPPATSRAPGRRPRSGSIIRATRRTRCTS